MRASGILMPIFSLPSRYGIGTFGDAAYQFVDFLKKAGQTYWQILPLNPTNYGDSPYQSFSSFAGNPYFIDIDLLIEKGLLTEAEARSFDFGKDDTKVDYGLLYQNRLPLLRLAAKRFAPDEAYRRFCQENSFWLEEYSLFMAIKCVEGEKAWQEWKAPLRNRTKAAMEKAKKEYADEMDFHRFVQYEFFCQWNALKQYANQKGIQFIGDIPIYVAMDSADIWSEPNQFLLEKGKPTLVAGCPPDSFTADGQKWGNPLYNWDQMKQDSYAWWKRRMKFAFAMYDIVRIDHFRGFESFYAIPFADRTARNGSWMQGPGTDLFVALRETFGKDMPIIAEDLGFLTEPVRQMLADTGFPGMKVLQFAFDVDRESEYLPHNYDKNSVVYIGTHDNDTILGWAKTATPDQLQYARNYLLADRNEGFNWAMIRLAMMSVSDTAIFLMQDILSLGSDARINTPSTLGGNWRWRMLDGCTNDWLAGILRDYTTVYGRAGQA